MIYVGVFLIAFSTLAFEITLTRILSVVSWYHLAFFAVSSSMLGMTAGATTVFLKPESYQRSHLNRALGRACLAYGWSIPISLVIICLIPLGLWQSALSLFSICIVTLACSLPFYFSGIVVTAALTQYDLSAGKVYATDLLGASFGCLLVLAALEVIDAPSLVLLCAPVGLAAGLCFAWQQPERGDTWRLLLSLFLLLLVVPLNATTSYGIRPLVIKGRLHTNAPWLERWNSFSRIAVTPEFIGPPQLWGPSYKAPLHPIRQHDMNIDGEAGTVIRRFHALEDIEHLRFDVTNLGYYLRPTGGACIVGVGGGRDLQTALLFGHKRVVGIDVNPIFVDLLENEFRSFAGLADRTEVALVVDEARSYLSRTNEEFALLQMSLIDTWASTGAGAFSLSENALYTVEGWQVFLKRLAPGGIFTVSRWYNPQKLGETGRLASLAVASLLEAGINEPARHLVMATNHNVCTLLVSQKPFTDDEIAAVKSICADLQYDLAFVPGGTVKDDTLHMILAARSIIDLSKVTQTQGYNYSPPTDEDPYFFNMIQLRQIFSIEMLNKQPAGVIKGNLMATFVLGVLILVLLLLTFATVVIPLVIKGRREAEHGNRLKISWPMAIYFSLIGAGFMFVEIALLQKFSVFLGHPVYALGIVLFTIIASTGVGSFVSEKIQLTRAPLIYIYPVVTAAVIIAAPSVLSRVSAAMITANTMTKILTTILILFPLGMLLGCFFPTGMKLSQQLGRGETPWYWALNGIFGVLCSAVAVLISIYAGISVNFYLAALCYGTIVICLASISQATCNRRNA